MKNSVLKNCFILISILVSAFFISVLFQNVFSIDEHVSTLFAFAVFLISLTTNGYVYGIISAFIGTLAINYAFTFPYFAFNFTIPVNLISAIVMITIALLTSALTTKIKLQEAIKAENERVKMRATLLRAVSHDIRTPLTTIYGSAESLLSNSELTEEQRKKMLVGIKEDSDWLVRMVENLLSVTRIDSGKVKISKTPIAIDELIDSVIVKFKKRYPSQNVILSLPEETVFVPMDPTLISQVLINLLENSVLHAGDFDRLELRVIKDADSVIFEIEDNGCGIPQDMTERLFDGYFGSNEGLADSKKKNAGIGLSVCAAIIKAHGGKITARNTEKGIVFRFILSVEEENQNEQQI
ncbi:MAG: DUF4118 domain-containing protein [Clostridia bacterium]|nr:DUF4118 domain-containing protein [Clostridia bacterium]MBO5914964.1 DUF4118 domain-containing protein [Clostridia bacterium]